MERPPKIEVADGKPQPIATKYGLTYDIVGRSGIQFRHENSPTPDKYLVETMGSGGAFIDATGALIGVTTATAIRGLTVVIPAGIAWTAAQRVLEGGDKRRGYLGVMGQSVTLSESQAASCGRNTALLVVGVAPGSAAAGAGVLVGDIVLALDETSTASPEELLDLLASQAVGRQANLKVLRGSAAVDLPVTIGERPSK